MSLFSFSALILILGLSLVVGTIVPRRLRLAIWTIVVIAGVVPWSSWVGHSHWDRIEWLPFSTTFRLRDATLNVLFYIPIGYFFVCRPTTSRAAILRACLYGFVLSVLTELSQVFGHGRFPGSTDVLTNTFGAWVGAVLATARQRLSAPHTSS